MRQNAAPASPGFVITPYGDELTPVKGRRTGGKSRCGHPLLGGVDDDSTLTFFATSRLHLKKLNQRNH
jgi:hypothetical protein